MTLIGDTMMWEQTGPKPVRGNAAGQRVEQPSHPFRAGLPARRSSSSADPPRASPRSASPLACCMSSVVSVLLRPADQTPVLPGTTLMCGSSMVAHTLPVTSDTPSRDRPGHRPGVFTGAMRWFPLRLWMPWGSTLGPS